jgi:hypothetical protein
VRACIVLEEWKDAAAGLRCRMPAGAPPADERIRCCPETRPRTLLIPPFTKTTKRRSASTPPEATSHTATSQNAPPHRRRGGSRSRLRLGAPGISPRRALVSKTWKSLSHNNSTTLGEGSLGFFHRCPTVLERAGCRPSASCPVVGAVLCSDSCEVRRTPGVLYFRRDRNFSVD